MALEETGTYTRRVLESCTPRGDKYGANHYLPASRGIGIGQQYFSPFDEEYDRRNYVKDACRASYSPEWPF